MKLLHIQRQSYPMASKRKLTTTEIDDLVAVIEYNPYKPVSVAQREYEQKVQQLTKQLESITIYPDCIPTLKEHLFNEYSISLVQAGDSVGILCAQSIGEKQTQANLNTFHKAGSAEHQPVTSQFNEIMYATKKPKMPIFYIHFNQANDDITTLRKRIGSSIVGLTLDQVVTNVEFSTNKTAEPWYDLYDLVEGNNDYRQLEGALILDINLEIICEYGLTLKQIADALNNCKYGGDHQAIYSPDIYAQIIIHIDLTAINLGDTMTEICKSKKGNKNDKNEKLKTLIVEELVKDEIYHNDKEREPWYDIYDEQEENTAYTEMSDCVVLQIDMKKMEQHKLTLKKIADSINLDNNNEYQAIYSPDDKGQIIVYVDTELATLDDVMDDIFTPKINHGLYITEDNYKEIYLEELVYEHFCQLPICGIAGINQIFFLEEDGKWFAETSNQCTKKTNNNKDDDNKRINVNDLTTRFRDILALDIVDMANTISNNMWDIYYVLGIEAVRQFIIEKLRDLVGHISSCHLNVLVDRMTITGSISAISRFSMTKDDPLTQASFEQAFDKLMMAGAFTQIDSTNGVSGAIISGKKVNIGTNMSQLKMKL